MRELTPYEQQLAAELAARHRIPKATVAHPRGVIVPGDDFMTKKLQDPDYVPYCGPCTPMQRMRRIENGFVCPTCGNMANWDLTTYNGNIHVEFDPEHADMGWVEKFKANLRDILQGAQTEAEAATRLKAAEEQRALDWLEDMGKKNTSQHKCHTCQRSFFGKKSRKCCRRCQPGVDQLLSQRRREQQDNPWEVPPAVNRKERRHG